MTAWWSAWWPCLPSLGTPHLPYDFINHFCWMWSSGSQLLSVTNPKDFPMIFLYICDNGFVHLRRMAITLAESWVKLLLGVTSILCHFRECDFTFIPSHPQSGAYCTSRCRSMSNRVHNSHIPYDEYAGYHNMQVLIIEASSAFPLTWAW